MQRMKQLLKQVGMMLTVSVVMFGGMEQAGAVTIIDFEALRHDDFGYAYHGNHYVEDSFALDNLSSSSSAAFATRDKYAYGFSGSTALFNNSSNGTTRLTSIDSSPFDLVSINLAEFYHSAASSVTFNGKLSDGSVVTQTVTLNGDDFDQQTFFFSGFDDVVSVKWMQQFPYHQFDNITINTDGMDPVPEPGTWLLMGTGLVGLLGYGLRKRQQTM